MRQQRHHVDRESDAWGYVHDATAALAIGQTGVRAVSHAVLVKCTDVDECWNQHVTEDDRVRHFKNPNGAAPHVIVPQMTTTSSGESDSRENLWNYQSV